MKKLFTLLIVMLLWQSAAVAQSFLQIITPEDTTEIPMAELDSVTIRLPKYCPLSPSISLYLPLSSQKYLPLSSQKVSS